MIHSDRLGPAEPSAEKIFADYLARLEGGEADFHSLCDAHPALRGELEELRSDWGRLEGVLSHLGFSSSLGHRLESEFGDAVSLDVDLDPKSTEESSPLMEQLVGRSAFHRYQVLSEIGRGGMGVVHRIWDEDLRRHLAMKRVRGRGERDPRRLSRFLEEAQVTGQLDHPGIVPVHELGLDAEGRVYFTMKLVRGEDLGTLFRKVAAEEDGWNRTRALNLLLRVSEAMAYAHERGVVHRDLKPGNVMVGAFGEVYVMDWGLARVRDREPAPDEGDLGEAAGPDVRIASPHRTREGDVVGSAYYMPPEQARGRVEDVGPHSDVYALGAIVYHLLAGRPPYSEPGDSRSSQEVVEQVAAGAPQPLESVAPETPAELIAICEKAMARRPEERYASMRAFGEDLRSYLEGRVVAAYEAGAVAELRKWVRRNRGMAASLAAAVLALAVGLAVSLVARVEADRRRAEAIAEAETTRSVARYLGDLLGVADPRRLGREARVTDLLEYAAEDVDRAFANRPAVRGFLHYAIGRTYQRLGDLELAEPELAESDRVAREEVDDEEPLALEARAFYLSSRGDFAEASAVRRRLLALQRERLGPLAPETLAEEYNLAIELGRINEYDEALELLWRSHAGASETLGPDRQQTLRTLHQIAATLDDAGRFEEAERTIGEVIAGLERSFERDHPELLAARRTQVNIAKKRGRLAEAEELLRTLLQLHRDVLAPDHPETLHTLNDLALVLAERGEEEAARERFEELLDVGKRRLDPDLPDLLVYRSNYAEFLRERGDLEQAEALHLEVFEARESKLGPENEDTLTSMSNVGLTRYQQGRYEEAEEWYLGALEGLERELGEGHPKTLIVLNNLSQLYQDTGRLADAVEVQTRAVEAFDPQDPRRHRARYNLASSLFRLGSIERAEEQFRAAWQGIRDAYGEAHDYTWLAQYNLATTLVERGKMDEAYPLLVELQAWPQTSGAQQAAGVARLLERIRQAR